MNDNELVHMLLEVATPATLKQVNFIVASVVNCQLSPLVLLG